MTDTGKTTEQLIAELEYLRARVAALEQVEAKRIQTEKALREQRDRAQQYLDIAAVVIVAVAADQTVSLINRAGCELLGYAEAEIIGRNWFENFLPLREREQVKAVFMRLMNGDAEPVRHFENRILTRDGQERIIAWHNALLVDNAGHILGTLSSGEDITEHKRAEEALRESLKTSADIVRAIPAGLFTYRYEPPDKLFLVDGNPEAERLTGINVEDWQGREFNEIWPQARVAGVTDAYLNVIYTGETFETEDLYYTDERLEGAFRIRAFCMSSDRLGVAFENVTEQKRAQEALRESEERFRKIFEEGPLGMGILSPDDHFIRANAKLCHMLGYTEEELKTLMFYDITHPEDVESGKRQAQQLLSGEMPFVKTEKRYVTQGGQTLWISLTATFIRNHEGQPLYKLTMIEDITERKCIEDERQHYIERLRILHKIDRAILTAESPQAIAQAALGHLRRLVPCSRASIVVFDVEADLAPILAVQMNGETRLDTSEAVSLSALRKIAPELWQGKIHMVEDLAPPAGVQSVARGLRDEGIRAYVNIPLISRGELIGVLNLGASTPGIFADEHLEIAREVADQLAIAIQHAHLFESEQKRRRIAEILAQAAAVLNATLELDQVMDLILRQLREVIAYNSASIQRLEDGYLTIIASQGFERPHHVVGIKFPLDPSFPNFRVVSEKKPLTIANIVQEYPHFQDQATIYESGHIRTWLGLPLVSRDQVIGMITLDRVEEQPFTGEDIDLAMAFANQAAIALQNAQLYEQVQTHARELENLLASSSDLSSTLDLDDLLSLIAERATALLQATECVIFRLEEDQTTIRPILALGEYAEDIMGSTLRVDEGLTGYAIAHNQTLLVNYAHDDPRSVYIGTPTERQMHVLVTPLVVHGRPIGAMVVNRPLGSPFVATDQQLFVGFAQQAAIAIENAQLYNQVQRHAAELEQRVAERTAELQQEKEQVEAILNSTADAMLITDPEGYIVSVNPALEVQTGYQASEIVGQPTQAIPDSVTISVEDFQAMWGTAQIRGHSRIEIAIRRKDGTVYDADLSIAPLYHNDGSVRGYVIAVRDISVQKEIGRMKDAFVSNVSHELRTPITNLKLRHHLLKSQPDRLDVHLPVLRRETERLSRIIGDLLTLSRMDQGQTTLNLRPLDLNVLARQYVVDRTSLVESKHLRLNLIGEPGAPSVEGDEGLLGQALSILLTNALYYTPPDGQVTVHVQTRHEDDRRWVGIAVSDTGPGISLDEQAHLFERFFRGTAGRESGTPGTGLGLAILKEIVERHQGQVEVASEGTSGKGATFTIWLPAKPPEQV